MPDGTVSANLKSHSDIFCSIRHLLERVLFEMDGYLNLKGSLFAKMELQRVFCNEGYFREVFVTRGYFGDVFVICPQKIHRQIRWQNGN